MSIFEVVLLIGAGVGALFSVASILLPPIFKKLGIEVPTKKQSHNENVDTLLAFVNRRITMDEAYIDEMRREYSEKYQHWRRSLIVKVVASHFGRVIPETVNKILNFFHPND